MDELRENRGSSWWRFGRAQSELYRAIPRHGFCAAELPRESARYRSLLAGQPGEAVQHGFPRASQTFDTGRRQRSTQLAHLGRLGYIADPACTQTVLQRQLRCRSDQYGLRTGCDDHRPVPVAVSMGTVSHQQGGGQIAYPAGFARQYSGFHPHHEWQDPRSQRAGYLVLRGRGFLRDGSGLSGFQSPVHAASVGGVLRNSRQTRNERAQGVLDEGRSKYRHHLRSAHRARRFLHLAGLSRTTEAHPLQRPGNRQDVGVPDQQHSLARTDDCRAVQKPLASRAVLQVDQATSAYQTFHRQQRECGENADLVRRRHLRADRHC